MGAEQFWNTYFDHRSTALLEGVDDLPKAEMSRDQELEWLRWRVSELSATVAVLMKMLEERGQLDVAECRYRAGTIMENAIVAVGGYSRCIKCDRSVPTPTTKETRAGSVCANGCRR